MRKRKPIGRMDTQVDQRVNSWDYLDMSEEDTGSASEGGQAVRDLVQCSTRILYESFGKESECSNNIRRHYRCDGKSKVPFDSLDKAKSACARLWDRNEDMRPYKCGTCGMYHIGHKRGEGHSIPYMFYKGGLMLGLVVDICLAIKKLFC